MDFRQVIETRRSVRSFADKDIPDDAMDRVLRGAQVAPSGNNMQPWHFVVVKDPERKSKLAEFAYSQSFVGKAPAVVVCCGKKYDNSYLPHTDMAYLIDTIIAVDHLVLAARNEGVGTCWIGAFDAKKVEKLVNAPRGTSAVMLIIMGYPANESVFGDGLYRKDLSEIVSKETL